MASVPITILQYTVSINYCNRDTAVPAEGNGGLQTLICVLVARPRRCPTLSNPVPWQNWIVAYLGYTLWMKMLFRGWPVIDGWHVYEKKKNDQRTWQVLPHITHHHVTPICTKPLGITDQWVLLICSVSYSATAVIVVMKFCVTAPHLPSITIYSQQFLPRSLRFFFEWRP